MGIKEIKSEDLKPEQFIEEKTKEIADIVGDGFISSYNARAQGSG